MKHLRILTCLLAALLCLALAGCNRSTAASAETVTVVQAEYDEDGNQVSVTMVPSTVTTAEYDEDGNLISTTQVPETVQDVEYDEDGNVISDTESPDTVSDAEYEQDAQ